MTIKLDQFRAGNRFACLALALAASAAAPLTVSASTNKKTQQKATSEPGQFVVQLKRTYADKELRFLERRLEARIIDEVREGVLLIQRDPQEPIDSALRELREKKFVQLVDPNFIYKTVRTPNDPDLKDLWGIKNLGGKDKGGTRGLQGVDIGAEQAWDITTGSQNVIVAVIDTGIDFGIPDLASNAWVNHAEKNGKPGFDDDGNGYVDDINGYNFVKNSANVRDDNGHGSHCAGTIGAQGDDGRGIVGVSWNVRLMALKFLDQDGGGTLANAIKAIDYARLMGAHVLSNSWGGGGYSAILRKAIEDSRDAGQVFVAAAGNDGVSNDQTPSYPASYDVENVVSVAALNNRGDLADFSNYGVKTVHVAAPGVHILSTVPGGYDYYSGTSMATPHVSGVAALLLADNPQATYASIKARLISHSRPLAAMDGLVASGGIVDAYYALTGLRPPADPNDPSNWTGRKHASFSTQHPYQDNSKVRFTIREPGAKRIAVRFGKFDTESIYDSVQFFDSSGESLGSMSGSQDGRFSPIADGDTIILEFATDESITSYGFDVEHVFFEP